MPVDTGRLPGVEAEHVLGGRYQLIDQLGLGGMAVVWRARDQVLGRTVAVKVLAGRHVDDPQSRQLIRAEARAAAALSHPNIAQVYDYGESYEHGIFMPYLVMELVKGPTLEQRMASGAMTPGFAMRVSAEVGAALAAAHADGLVHRDIKPANVMLTSVGAKVVDFGIAAAIGPGSSREEFEVLGTPAYLAPERLSDDAVTPACDVYALGLLLYRLLTGALPWSVDSTTQMLTAHIYIEPTPLPQLADVPEYVTAMGNRCLSKDPTLRPSARDAAALLARGAGLRVVEDAEPARVPTGPAVDREPSLLIRRPIGASTELRMDPARARALAAASPAGPAAAPAGPPEAAARPPEAAAGPAGAAAGPAGAAAGSPRLPAQPSGERPRLPAQPSGDPRDPGPPPAGHGPAAKGEPHDGHPDAALAAGPSSAGTKAPPAVTGPYHRRALLGAVAIVLVSAAALLWLVLPRGRDGGDSVVVLPTGAASSSAGPAPSTPPASASTPAPGSARTTPPGTPTRRTAGPGGGAGTGAPDDMAPADPPDDPVTTTPPVTTPQERTLSSDGGTVLATCPTATTALLESWTPTKPYKVDDVSPGPAESAVVVFRHGNRRVQMTVTCSAGIPATNNEDV